MSFIAELIRITFFSFEFRCSGKLPKITQNQQIEVHLMELIGTRCVSTTCLNMDLKICTQNQTKTMLKSYEREFRTQWAARSAMSFTHVSYWKTVPLLECL